MSEDIFRKRISENGAEYLYIPELDDRFPVRTFFTTRNGGVSGGPYKSLNMGYNTGDDAENVTANRNLMFESLGTENPVTVFPSQVHRADIGCMDSSCQVPEERIVRFPDTDATVTDMKGVILTSLHADCIPVWLYDPVRNAAGVAHAGWKGTRADIAAKTVRFMCERYGSEAGDIIAVIGPGIGMCCFEVGAEVYESFREMTGGEKFPEELASYDGNGKYHMDLKGINRMLLERAGVKSILVTDLCTFCRDDLFFSYRRDGGVTGRMCAGICLI